MAFVADHEIVGTSFESIERCDRWKGATGAVLMTKLLYQLERTGGRYGLQTMCIGHGMATATIIERM